MRFTGSIYSYQFNYGGLVGAKIYYQNDEELGVPNETLLTIATIDPKRDTNQCIIVCEEDLNSDGSPESFMANLDDVHDWEVPSATQVTEKPKRKKIKGRR